MEYKIPFSTNSFKYLKKLASEYAGIELTDDKKGMLYARLSHALLAFNLKSFDEYCSLLKQGNREYLKTFIHGITTHETHFFREEHHFDYLKDKFIPEFVARSQGNTSIKILSAI